MKRSPIMDTTARLIFHSALVFSLYLLFAGHNQPGGGFVGGLVAGTGVAVYYVAGGIDDVRSISRLPAWTVLGAGLVLATAAAVWPLAVGGELLESDLVSFALPALGEIKVVSVILFDAGVYAVVVGLVFMVFEAFGEEVAPSEGPR